MSFVVVSQAGVQRRLRDSQQSRRAILALDMLDHLLCEQGIEDRQQGVRLRVVAQLNDFVNKLFEAVVRLPARARYFLQKIFGQRRR